MIEAAQALVSANRSVSGHAKKISLCDAGYCAVGVDEGWEACGQGIDGTQHNADGTPTIESSFPDTKGMVDQIHDMGLKAGWYLNGCKCGEHVEKEINYEGDIQNLHDFGFDAVKIDRCGKQLNETLYADLMRKSGRNYSIENCHWGICTDSDDSSCPTQDWCPFNWYRTSGDVNSSPQSWLINLQTAIKFLDYEAPLSQPGCWAYPDMLEVGRVAEPTPGTFYSWNRAHFGAWCVISSPLILGMELSDDKLNPVLDIITNEEAIKVNQQWSGHPGMLVENILKKPVPYNPGGAVVPTSTAGDIDAQSPAEVRSAKEDSRTSGGANIRTGSPGQTSVIHIGSPIEGQGHLLESVSMSFRYSAGYTPAQGQTKKAAVVKVQVRDLATEAILATLFTSDPLGDYSYDHFTSYSPLIKVSATKLSIPNDSPVVITLEVTNNDRNLQIPVDDLADGFNVHVAWSQKSGGPQNAVTAGISGAGQVWAKPQPGGALAVLVINTGIEPLTQHSLNFPKLNLTTGTYTVRDIWEKKDLGAATGQFPVTVPPYDSAFLLLTPDKVIV